MSKNMKNMDPLENPWLTIRADSLLKGRLITWKKKFRRPSISDAARMIIEDRLTADGIK